MNKSLFDNSRKNVSIQSSILSKKQKDGFEENYNETTINFNNKRVINSQNHKIFCNKTPMLIQYRDLRVIGVR